MILPSGLVTGYTYRDFLRHLLSTKTLASFFGFENEDKLFKSVHNETKFGLLTVTGGREKIEQPWFTAHIRQPEQITDPDRRYALTVDEIEAINPNTLNLPAFRFQKDAEVTAAIHKAAPILVRNVRDGESQNTWAISLRTMFNTSTDSHEFIEHAEISDLIVSRRGALAELTDGRRIFPLTEGKMLWHFDHRYGTYEGQTEKQANKGVLPRVTDQKHDDPSYYIQPRYWVEEGVSLARLEKHAKVEWFIALRDVGPSERTLVGSIVARSAIGDIPLIFSEERPENVVAFAAILSSLVLDYAVRQKSSRMKMFVIEQLPVLTPDHLQLKPSWTGTDICAWLVTRAFELYYTNIELCQLAADLGCQHPPFRWQPDRRIVLQAEIDAAVMHLYGLNRTQAEWLLDSFTVLRKYEERDHDEFRTKRVVLEMYDEIAVAKQAGCAYQTRLNPVPADPSCCHAPTIDATAHSLHRQGTD